MHQNNFKAIFVDDELHGNAKFYANLLIECFPGNVLSMETGKDLLEKLKTNAKEYDIAFIDYSLSGEIDSGIELGTRISDIAPHIALVMLSAYRTFQKCREAMQVGFIDYLPKDSFILYDPKEKFEEEIKQILQSPGFKAKQAMKKLQAYTQTDKNDRLNESLYKKLKCQEEVLGFLKEIKYEDENSKKYAQRNIGKGEMLARLMWLKLENEKIEGINLDKKVKGFELDKNCKTVVLNINDGNTQKNFPDFIRDLKKNNSKLECKDVPDKAYPVIQQHFKHNDASKTMTTKRGNILIDLIKEKKDEIPVTIELARTRLLNETKTQQKRKAIETFIDAIIKDNPKLAE